MVLEISETDIYYIIFNKGEFIRKIKVFREQLPQRESRRLNILKPSFPMHFPYDWSEGDKIV